MGKWAARLAGKTAAPPSGVTAKTAKTPPLSVLSVPAKGGDDVFFLPSPSASAEDARPKSLDLAAVAWTDADISAFLDRRARLMRWGWSEDEAEKLADRLVRRDREGDDDRVSCADCKHYRPGRCGNHKVAGIEAPNVSRDLASLLQRCPGFGSNGEARAEIKS